MFYDEQYGKKQTAILSMVALYRSEVSANLVSIRLQQQRGGAPAGMAQREGRQRWFTAAGATAAIGGGGGGGERGKGGGCDSGEYQEEPREEAQREESGPQAAQEAQKLREARPR